MSGKETRSKQAIIAAADDKQKATSPRDPLDVPVVVDVKEDKDSTTLFHLKRFWRQARKRDKQRFTAWTKTSRKDSRVTVADVIALFEQLSEAEQAKAGERILAIVEGGER